MSQSNVAGWMPALIGPVVIQVGGVAQTPRSVVNFAGATSSDNPATDTLTITQSGNPTTLAADGTGYASITGQVRNTSNAKVDRREYNISAVNATAAATTVLTIPTSTGKTYSIRGIVALANSPASAFGEFEINAYARNNVGTVTLESSTVTTKANNSSFVVALSVSGTNLIVQVTDPGTGRRITGEVYVAERTF